MSEYYRCIKNIPFDIELTGISERPSEYNYMNMVFKYCYETEGSIYLKCDDIAICVTPGVLDAFFEKVEGKRMNKQYESEDKMVSHPDHYQSSKGIEVIDVIEAFTEDLQGIEAVDTANAIKYICRWKHKNGVQDLDKAIWYITHLINHLKEQGNS